MTQLDLYIPANTLVAHSTYAFRYETNSSGVIIGASVSLDVARSPLVIVFDLGSRTVSTAHELVLDASGSFDPDNPSMMLLFAWSCIRNDGRTCDFSVEGNNTSTARVAPDTLLDGVLYTFTVVSALIPIITVDGCFRTSITARTLMKTHAARVRLWSSKR